MKLATAWRRLSRADWPEFLRGIFEYNVLKHYRELTPRYLMVPITYRCNARCTMCNIWRGEKKPELTAAQFRDILPDRLFERVDRLTFTGGEPVLRADLLELTDVFMDSLPSLATFSLITNGFLPQRVEEYVAAVIDRCRERGLALSVSVSLDGVGEVHDRIRGVPGGFERVRETLERLKALQEDFYFWLGASSVLFKGNLHHRDELREWCREQGISQGFQIVGFHDAYLSNVDLQEQIDFSAEDKEELFALLEELARPRSIEDLNAYYWSDLLHMYRDGDPRRTPCPFAWDAFALDAYGDLSYCLSVKPIGNCLTDGPCSEIYYRPDNLAKRRRMRETVCRTCNSGCMVHVGLKKDLKRYLWFLLTRHP